MGCEVRGINRMMETKIKANPKVSHIRLFWLSPKRLTVSLLDNE